MSSSFMNDIPYLSANDKSPDSSDLSVSPRRGRPLSSSQIASNDHQSPDDSGIKLTKKKEVYKFQSDWLVSSVAWSNEIDDSFQLAISSFIENYTNYVQLVKLTKDDCDHEIESLATFEHPYPATKILWIPKPTDSFNQVPRLLATTADYLRIWRVSDKISDVQYNGNLVGTRDEDSGDTTDVRLESLLNNNQGSKLCAPLTSFDWNDIDPRIIVTASVDTTCTIWDLETSVMIDRTSHTMGTQSDIPVKGKIRTQLVAHDHQVYDVSFSRAGSGKDVFVSSSGDGSVRLFDLRRLSTSTVLFEVERATPKDKRAIVRVSCCKRNENLVSVFTANSNKILMLDVRKPGRPMSTLSNHTADLNSMSWAPHSAHHISSGSDDGRALIWELSKLPNPIDEPLLTYNADAKINTISWSLAHPDWIAIGFRNCLELLRV